MGLFGFVIIVRHRANKAFFFPQWQQGSLKPNLCAQTSKFEQHNNKKKCFTAQL